LVLAARRKDRLDALAAELGNARAVAIDLSREGAASELVANIEAAGETIDLLVNNAGFGLHGRFDKADPGRLRRMIDLNCGALTEMCREVLPGMIERRSGAIINVTSSATLAPMPLAAAYTASKQAIEGFTASLAHELGYFGIRAKLVEPGYAPTTRFTQNTAVRIEDMIPEAYADFAAPIFEAFAQPALTTRESDVAEAVWAAVHDTSGQLRFPAGPDAVALAKAG